MEREKTPDACACAFFRISKILLNTSSEYKKNSKKFFFLHAKISAPNKDPYFLERHQRK
jgi:hypothetical protein